MMLSKVFYRLKEFPYPRICILFMITFLGIGLLTEHVHLLINTSFSFKEHYFLHLPKVNPVKGDITTYEHTSGKRLIKKIIGVEGDVISYDADGFLFVSGIKVGKPYSANSKGVLLHSIPSGVLPKDYVFLYATHDESLDSRYSEIGLVYRKHLIGKAIAII